MNTVDLIISQMEIAKRRLREAKSPYRYDMALEDILDLNQELLAAVSLEKGINV